VTSVCTGWLDDEPYAHGRRQVVHDVALVDELVDHRPVQDGVDDEVETVPFAEMLDVLERAGGEVVEHPHLVSLVEQELRQVRPDEPRAARD
jgi:hypothetical protein